MTQPIEAREWWDSLTDEDRWTAYLIEKSNADSLAALPFNALSALRAGVEGLTDHAVSGYEWEDDCHYSFRRGKCDRCGRKHERAAVYYGEDGFRCPHYDQAGAISRAAVLALIDRITGRTA